MTTTTAINLAYLITRKADEPWIDDDGIKTIFYANIALFYSPPEALHFLKNYPFECPDDIWIEMVDVNDTNKSYCQLPMSEFLKQ